MAVCDVKSGAWAMQWTASGEGEFQVNVVTTEL